ncbi:hypothetical protein [Neorhizobium tomejilense]|uniref:hypothetical protein n=1 Tax=Neorhizobium tomejilense TaxID=2093828 RepID=UPI003ECE9AD4
MSKEINAIAVFMTFSLLARQGCSEIQGCLSIASTNYYIAVAVAKQIQIARGPKRSATQVTKSTAPLKAALRLNVGHE